MKRVSDRKKVSTIESLEQRTLMSGTEALTNVLVPQTKTGNLEQEGDSAAYTFNLAKPGWISVDFESYFVGTGQKSLKVLDSKGNPVRFGGTATLPKIDDLAGETPKNRLPAGDYSIVLTRTYPLLTHPNTAYTMRFVAAYAGTSASLAPDEGDIVPYISGAALEGYLGTVGNLLSSNHNNYYKFYAPTPETVSASVFGLSEGGIAVLRDVKRNGVIAQVDGVPEQNGSSKALVNVPAGTFYVEAYGATKQSYLLQVAAMLQQMNPRFTWSMPDRYGIDTNHNGIIDLPNSAQYANPSGFPVSFDATSSQSTTSIVSDVWSVSGGSLRKPLNVDGSKWTWSSAPEGTYSVKLTVLDGYGFSASTSQTVTVRNYLIVALGDSYGSGEGNPEAANSNPNNVKWADGVSTAMTRENFEAHRSSLCASSQAALMLERSDPHTSVTYINLCESGADIPEGMLGPLTGRVHSSYALPAEIAELHKIIGSRKIDALGLSIGGNDFGFTDYLSELLTGSASDSQIKAQATKALAALNQRYQELASALDGFSIGKTFITAYPDLTQVGPSQFVKFATDVLPMSLVGISADSAKFASQDLLSPLNHTVMATAQTYGWTYVSGYLNDFLTHGYAAQVPWFRTMSEAERLQGSDYPILGWAYALSRGGFHPNTAGHADIAGYLYAAIASELSAKSVQVASM